MQRYGGIKTIDYVPAIASRSARPTIRGYSTWAPGTVLTVIVDGQTYLVTVQSNGTWSFQPSGLQPAMWDVSVAGPTGSPIVFTKAVRIYSHVRFHANISAGVTKELNWSY